MRSLHQPIVNVLLGIGTAIVLSVQVPLKWWHPYCDTQDDGPGWWGRGFILPFLEPTGVSSGELLFQLPVFAMNIVILAIPLTLLIALAGRAWPPILRLILSAALIMGLVISVLQLTIAMVPTMRVSEGNDSLLSYRPAFLVDFAQHRACYS